MIRARKCGLLSGAVAAALVAAVGLSSAPALAQGKPKPAAAAPKPLTDKQKKDLAKKNYGDAEKKLGASDYAGALVLYKAADDLVPGPPPKYKIALCLDKLNKVQETVAAYQLYLDAKPDPDKQKDNIAAATARIDALKKTPGKIHIAIDPPDVLTKTTVKITVDTQIPPSAPEKATFVINPGHHQLVATADGYDQTKIDFDLNFAESRDITVSMKEAAPPPTPVAVVPVAPPPPPPAPPPPPRSKVPAYVTLGLAGAGVVVGTIFGIKALSDKSTFNKTPNTPNADTTDRDALISDMSFAIALTFGVTGTVLLLSNGDSEAKAATLAPKSTTVASVLKRGFLTPYVGPSGGGAVGTFHF